MEDGAVEGERVPLRADATGRADSSAMISGGELEHGGDRDMILPQWPTVDGLLGVSRQDASKLARNFFLGGFCFLPWLWFVNCFYFYPVLRHRHLDPVTRPYILWSAIGCSACTIVLLAWSLTFAIGREQIFGSSWNHLAVYNIADKYAMAWAQ